MKAQHWWVDRKAALEDGRISGELETVGGSLWLRSQGSVAACVRVTAIPLLLAIRVILGSCTDSLLENREDGSR